RTRGAVSGAVGRGAAEGHAARIGVGACSVGIGLHAAGIAAMGNVDRGRAVDVEMIADREVELLISERGRRDGVDYTAVDDDEVLQGQGNMRYELDAVDQDAVAGEWRLRR